MALVIVSGLPSSGRSTRCKEIIADWQRRLDEAPSSSTRPPFSRIVHLEDSTAHLARSVYSSQYTEKPARASYLSLVSRSLVKDAIVVADGGAGLNIKGFRYQLWCAAREVGMACISVFVTASGEQCVRWNEKRRRIGSDCYDAATLAEMLQRFEEPNAMTRWDSPLFIIPSEPRASSSSDEASLDEWEDPPYDALWEALASKKSFSKAPPVVTHNRATSTNYLSVLESSSQALVAAMQQGLQHGVMGDSLPLAITLPNGALASSGGSSLSITLALPASRRPPTPAHLQRLRRQFVKMHSAGFASGNVLGKVATDE
ncbi:chromatin associated protein KTI12, partial [Jaminaea rosea]